MGFAHPKLGHFWLCPLRRSPSEFWGLRFCVCSLSLCPAPGSSDSSSPATSSSLFWGSGTPQPGPHTGVAGGRACFPGSPSLCVPGRCLRPSVQWEGRLTLQTPPRRAVRLGMPAPCRPTWEERVLSANCL